MSTYEIALSFASEQRDYVEEVAQALRNRGIVVFYDKFEKVALWGKHLAVEFQKVYEKESRMVVMFISAAYVEKEWPRHEKQSILSRAVMESREYVMPVRFDDTEVPGLTRDVAYLHANDYPPAELADMIEMKLLSLFDGNALKRVAAYGGYLLVSEWRRYLSISDQRRAALDIDPWLEEQVNDFGYYEFPINIVRRTDRKTLLQMRVVIVATAKVQPGQIRLYKHSSLDCLVLVSYSPTWQNEFAIAVRDVLPGTLRDSYIPPDIASLA